MINNEEHFGNINDVLSLEEYLDINTDWMMEQAGYL